MDTQASARARASTVDLLRIFAGFLFWQHGAQKLLGWFGGNQVESLVSLMGLAGVLELVGGLLILVGLFTRPVAFVLAGEMAVAYFLGHFPRGFWTVENRGETAVLFCFVFLLLWAHGSGKISVDALLRRRREGVPTS